jgi:queuosine precursor transporter
MNPPPLVAEESHVNRTIGIVAAVALVGTVFAANWAIVTFGFVPVGFGLVAPAGVYFAGIAFGLRDVVHDALGRRAVFACIAAGGLVSVGVSPVFAFASATAFVVSELADLAVYEPLRERNWAVAAGASNIVGAFVDSVLFLWIAFGSLEHLAGQVVGKAWMGALGVALVAGFRAARRTEVPA